MRDNDLHPSHRTQTSPHSASSSSDDDQANKLRLFEVQDVEAVFGQIYFAKDMLGCVHFCSAVFDGISQLICFLPERICPIDTTLYYTIYFECIGSI